MQQGMSLRFDSVIHAGLAENKNSRMNYNPQGWFKHARKKVWLQPFLMCCRSSAWRPTQNILFSRYKWTQGSTMLPCQEILQTCYFAINKYSHYENDSDIYSLSTLPWISISLWTSGTQTFCVFASTHRRRNSMKHKWSKFQPFSGEGE